MNAIEINNLTKKFASKDNEFIAVNDVSLVIEFGEFIAVVGESGAGKSTLFYMLAGLDKPSGGEIIINGKNICNMKKNEITKMRRKDIGLIYQFYNLIPILTVEENILLSDMVDQGVINNVGWLSRLFKAVVVAAVAVAVAVVTVATCGAGAAAVVAVGVAALTTSAIYNAQQQTQAAINYESNKKLTPKDSGTIYGQDNYSAWKFGVRTMDYNGCGVIASYNAMYLLNRKESLAKVAYEIESKSGALAWGYAGTDPSHPSEYFRSKGIAIQTFYSLSNIEDSAKKMSYQGKVILLCFWNDAKDIKQGAHFIALKKLSSGTFEAYNYYGSDWRSRNFNTLTDSVDDGKLIMGYIIN